MIFNVIILLVCALIPGLIILRKSHFSELNVRYFLVFAGAYLFAMTVIHLIPDLFLSGENPFNLGLYILVGFFLQKVLENFSNGVEHGHLHLHSKVPVTYLLIALVIHSFLEGSILTDSLHSHHNPIAENDTASSPKILLGIVMHKIPASLALTALLVTQLRSKTKAFFLLLIFALGSPLGLISSEYLSSSHVLSPDYLIIFFAVVAGSFLQISTTIFIESDPHHKLDWKRFSVSLLGAGAAVIAQLSF